MLSRPDYFGDGRSGGTLAANPATPRQSYEFAVIEVSRASSIPYTATATFYSGFRKRQEEIEMRCTRRDSCDQ